MLDWNSVLRVGNPHSEVRTQTLYSMVRVGNLHDVVGMRNLHNMGVEIVLYRRRGVETMETV